MDHGPVPGRGTGGHILSPSPPLSQQIPLFRALYRAGDAAHDFDHVLRVTALAHRIAQAEGADVETVRLAALLHDVPVHAEAGPDRGGHHRAAADFAQGFLTDCGMPADQVAGVTHAIRAHRFRDASVPPETLEARCLYDGDKLDSMGAIGVARAFAYAGAHHSRLWTEPWPAIDGHRPPPTGADYTPVHEFVFKLQRLQQSLYTETGRSLARQRHRVMVDFFTWLDREMEESR